MWHLCHAAAVPPAQKLTSSTFWDARLLKDKARRNARPLPDMSSNPDHLVLDRSLTNRNFLSWRLSRDPGPSLHSKVVLPGKVCAEKKNAYDYIHTRISVLHNNLTQCGEALYTFTQVNAQTISLQRSVFGMDKFTPVAGKYYCRPASWNALQLSILCVTSPKKL